MFKWIQNLRLPRAPAPSRSPLDTSPEIPVRIAAALRTSQDRAAFEEIGRAFGWTTHVFPSFVDAVSSLQHNTDTLLIIDRDLCEDDWRPPVADVARCYPSTCILLASTVRDQYLWDEVIRQGGHDVVLKPFRKDDLKRAVRFASIWMEWSAKVTTRASLNHK